VPEAAPALVALGWDGRVAALHASSAHPELPLGRVSRIDYGRAAETPFNRS